MLLRKIHCEGEAPNNNVYVPPRKKLSIYDEPHEDYKVVDEPTQLELGLRKLRHSVTDSFASTRIQIESVVDKWIALEKETQRVVSRYAVPEEKLLPNGLYVALSGFAGSIAFKNRSIVMRGMAPPALALATFTYLYPKTSQNIYSKSWDDAAKAGLVPKEVPGKSLFSEVSSSFSSGYNSAKDAVSKLFK
ncbi:hypothetical protein HDV05_003918 [Chytridiales sp. JEL 0842]|nr:hypothetical protein HDV05_003918 [Chytridiales sp. JEL 0842]